MRRRHCQAQPGSLSQVIRKVIEVHAVGVPEHDEDQLHPVWLLHTLELV